MVRTLKAVVMSWLLLAMGAVAAEAPTHSAVTPAPRTDAWWQARHAAMNERVKQGNADLLFIGDSITQGWEGAGKEVWAKHYAPRNAVNLGIGGDRTQHVLYRLLNGNLQGISPKAAVLMIGTNNSNGADNTAGEIADGVTAIVKLLREKQPQAKILVLAIFPRGEKPNPQREKLAQVNSLVAKLADGKQVFFMDIGANLSNPDGTIFKDVMPDFLHLSPKGYEIWATSIEGKLKELLGEK